MKSNYPILYLKKDRIPAIKRKHPWIFSRAIIKHPSLEDGTLIELRSKQEEFLAIGYYQDASIMVRVLSFEPTLIDQSFWEQRISNAYETRKKLQFFNSTTNAYRLIHGEGDLLPGLIIDIYKEVAVVQCHAIGMHLQLESISRALQKVLGDTISTIFDKSKNALPPQYASKINDGPIFGNLTQTQILENGHRFIVDFIKGQKTGFFLDQRDNREWVGKYSKGKKVLNLYAYTGGFSIYALNNGAEEVLSIDASKTAIRTLEENVELNGTTNHHSLVEDVNKYLRHIEANIFDIIIVDPPAFAKSVRKKHNAIQAYKRVNALALSKIKKGGYLFTFSCSQVIDQKTFYDTITAAAIETGRDCQVVRHLSQGADHPVNIFHPEGKYLKGLMLIVQ